MNLRFWQREAPKELLAGKYANVGELGIAWDDYDLPPELLNQPLGVPYAGSGVDMAYESENPRSEAHLYARNPREIKESIVQQAEMGTLQLIPSLWSTLTAPEFLPQSVVIGPKPYTETNRRQLYAEDFYPTASSPSGSIKAVRVYNHGACSTQKLTTDSDGTGLLDEVGQALWAGFAAGVLVQEDDLECRTWAHPYRVFSSSMNYLDHQAGEQRDLRGGFFLRLHYGTTIDSIFAENLQFRYTARYEYTLIDGILGLGERHVDGYASGYDAEKFAAQVSQAFGDCIPKFPYNIPPLLGTPFEEIPEEYRCQDIPKGVYLAAKKEQTQYVLEEPWQSACLTKQKNPCASAAEIAQEGVGLGADTLETLGLESFSVDDRNAMKDAISERTDPSDPSSPLKHWTCIPSAPNSTKGQCAFTVRAKRLNVYPDAVELVWFDGKEVDNPTYALYVAAHMKTGTDPSNGFPTFDESKVDKLCSYHPGILGETREFTLSNQGFGDEWEFIPSICKNGFDWHVDCSFHGPPPRRGAWAFPIVGLALAAARRWGRKTTGRS